MINTCAGPGRGAQTARARSAVRALYDAGLPVVARELEKRIGVGHTIIELAVAVERALAEQAANADPSVDPATLPASAKRKLEIAERRLAKAAERSLAARYARLDEEVRQKTQAAVAKQLETLNRYEKEAIAERERYRELTNKHRPVFTPEEWELLRRVVHPDNSATEPQRAQAFSLINGRKLQLTGKK